MRDIQDLSPVEIEHILQDAPKRCYSEIASEMDVYVNTVKRVIRNHNNNIPIQVKPDVPTIPPQSQCFEPGGQRQDHKGSTCKMSSGTSTRTRCDHRNYQANCQGTPSKKYKQLTLC